MLHLLTEQIADEDLAALLEAFRATALTGNRVALDLFCIIEREMLRRCRGADISEYSDDDIAGALVMLTAAVDASRAEGMPDDEYPAVQFLLLAITSLAAEVESRGLVQRLQ